MRIKNYTQKVTNKKTSESVVVSATDTDVLEQKVNTQLKKWERENYIQTRQQEAIDESAWANTQHTNAQNILAHTAMHIHPDMLFWQEPTRDDYTKNFALLKFCTPLHKAMTKKPLQQYAADVASVQKHNTYMRTVKKAYDRGTAYGVARYSTEILKACASQFLQEFDISFDDTTGILCINYAVPDESALPRTHRFTYKKATDTIEPKELSQNAYRHLYMAAITGMAIRLSHELYVADYRKHITRIIARGIEDDHQAATGTFTRHHIAFLETKRTQLIHPAINVARADAQELFTTLNGTIDLTNMRRTW